jgi:nitrite reductase (NADH) large subunit
MLVRTMQRIAVIGNGMAGARLVEEVLARSGRERFELTIFGDEPYGNYNRILLSSVLAGQHDPEEIFINPLDWYAEHGVTLHAGERVEAIDRAAKTLRTASGAIHPYDVLVLATGSVAFEPPIDGLRDRSGALIEGAFVFRTLDDCSAIAARAERARTAAVIGGGLLGLEAARGLRSRGLDVHVVHVMRTLMESQLDDLGGSLLKPAIERLGVDVHLEKTTAAIIGSDRVEGLRFSDGSTLKCDLLVIAAGIRPNVALAQSAGIAIERGIVVQDDLSSVNAPGVFAIGECAQHRGTVYGLVAPAWEQASVLADRLCGTEPARLYTGSCISTKLKVMGVELAVLGERDVKDERDEAVTYVEPSRGLYKKVIVRDGKVRGAMLLGDTATFPQLLEAYQRGSSVPENRAELLFSSFDAPQSLDAGSLPESAQICNCNGVTKGAIANAVRAGHCTVKAVCDATRAGSGCGSCKPQVLAVVEAVAGVLKEDPTAHYYVPGVPMTKPELVAAIKQRGLRSVSAVFDALANGKDDPASKPGLASLLKTIWGVRYEHERDARFINDRVHANIQNDGTFSVVPRIYGGVTTPAQLRRIADVAEKYKARMVKVTGGQRIDLLGIPKESLADVWRELDMPSGHAYTKAFRTCKTCVGSDFCRYGVGDSTALGIAIERRFQGIESPAKMKLATAGCPRNCSEATTKDVGAVAIEGARWEIYVGGAAGSRVRKGDLLCIVETHDDVLRIAGRFMQYYREHAKYQERTYDFVERTGINRLRAILIEDVDGIAAELDARMREAVDAYADPWSDAQETAQSAIAS